MKDFVPRGRHLFVYDVVATFAAILIAFALRFDLRDLGWRLDQSMPAALLPLLIMPAVYVAFGLYRREWRYASVQEMYLITFAVLVGTAITTLLFVGLGTFRVPGSLGYPRSIFAIEGLLDLAFVGGARFALRASLERRGISGGTDQERGVLTIVYGAGETGAMVARVAARDPAARLVVAGFIDDEPSKHNSILLGKRVFGGLDALPAAVRRTHAEQLLVAMPTAPGRAIRQALEQGRRLGLDVKVAPHPRELVNGQTELHRIRPVSVEDLLRRPPIEIDMEAVAGYLNGASVLVTGGGGSIGSELVRQIVAVGPRQITVVDNHEEALWSIEREIREHLNGTTGVQFDAVLCDIRSIDAIEAVIARAEPDVVFHAAALKHVPIVEQHPSEGAMTNVIGTRNVVAVCERLGVERFVLISTDKAVEPIGAMGATKRLAELITVASARRTGRPYAAVRFGNVLGSSGSVIPTFQHQLERGQPLTITHPDATRYFMTIPEAVSLILEAGATAEGGEIFVLDMGQPVRIVELAHDLIRLSGLDPDRVPVVYTGLRAGERLHETLFYESERTERTGHEGILRVRGDSLGSLWGTVDGLVAEIELAGRRRHDDVVRELLRRVPALGVRRRHAAAWSGLRVESGRPPVAVGPGRPGEVPEQFGPPHPRTAESLDAERNAS